RENGYIDHYAREDLIGLPFIAANLRHFQGHKRRKLWLQRAQQRPLYLAKRIKVLIDFASSPQARKSGHNSFENRRVSSMGSPFIKPLSRRGGRGDGWSGDACVALTRKVAS